MGKVEEYIHLDVRNKKRGLRVAVNAFRQSGHTRCSGDGIGYEICAISNIYVLLEAVKKV